MAGEDFLGSLWSRSVIVSEGMEAIKGQGGYSVMMLYGWISRVITSSVSARMIELMLIAPPAVDWPQSPVLLKGYPAFPWQQQQPPGSSIMNGAPVPIENYTQQYNLRQQYNTQRRAIFSGGPQALFYPLFDPKANAILPAPPRQAASPPIASLATTSNGASGAVMGGDNRGGDPPAWQEHLAWRAFGRYPLAPLAGSKKGYTGCAAAWQQQQRQTIRGVVIHDTWA